MAKVYYVKCTSCQKEYYLDQILFEVVRSNPQQKLKCPFCKKEFHLEKNKPMFSKGDRE